MSSKSRRDHDSCSVTTRSHTVMRAEPASVSLLDLCISESLPLSHSVSADVPATLFSSSLGKWQTFITQLERHQDKPCVCSLDDIQ